MTQLLADRKANTSWGLVERFQAGDRGAAFADIYATYAPTVYRFVFGRTRSPELADDLTADTFLRAYKQLDKLVWQGRDLAAWLVTIARNLIADYYKSGRYRFEIVSDHTHMVHSPDGQPTPDEVAMAAVTRALLREAMAELTPDQYRVVVLRYVQGLSVDEAAEQMGRHAGAVKALTWRAVQQMRKTATRWEAAA